MITTTVGQRSTTNNCQIGTQNVYIAISGCRSLSQSPGISFLALNVVENPRFAVGIVILSVVYFQWHNYFRFWWPYRYFRLPFDVIVICWSKL